MKKWIEPESIEYWSILTGPIPELYDETSLVTFNLELSVVCKFVISFITWEWSTFDFESKDVCNPVTSFITWEWPIFDLESSEVCKLLMSFKKSVTYIWFRIQNHTYIISI